MCFVRVLTALGYRTKPDFWGCLSGQRETSIGRKFLSIGGGEKNMNETQPRRGFLKDAASLNTTQ